MRILFRRQRKSTIDPNMVLLNKELFVELPDDTKTRDELYLEAKSNAKDEEDINMFNVNFEYLSNLICRYKIGDGVTAWKDLEYIGVVPAGFVLNDSRRYQMAVGKPDYE